jgi:mRNA interferase MazF
MKRGDIVLAQFPHAAGTPAKNRPVLVVQADYYNQRISNVLFASITTNLARVNDAAHYLIDVATSDGKKSGLRQNSVVSCLNLAVLPKADVGQKIGALSPQAMVEVENCLKAALGMS